MSRNAKGSGRIGSGETLRELVTLLGSFSQTGDTVTIDAVSQRLGVSQDEARRLMDIVIQASGEETSGLLISSDDAGDEYTLQYPGVHGRPIRLTRSETISVIRGLDIAGVSKDDPLRRKLLESLSAPGVTVESIRQALGEATNDDNLLACAQSLIDHRELRCLYKGLRDTKPRNRRLVVRHLEPTENGWHILAYDLDLGEERTFRADRMSDIVLANTQMIPSEIRNDPRQLPCMFTSRLYYDAFSWPGLHVTHVKDNRILGSIAYYGNKSTWLLRRIVACEGTFFVDDKRIMQAAQEYAQDLLNGRRA